MLAPLHLPWAGSFGCRDADGTRSDRSAGRAVDGDGIVETGNTSWRFKNRS